MFVLQYHAIALLQKTGNVLGNKDYIDVKISDIPHFIHHFKGNKHTLPKTYFTSAFLKTVIEEIYD